jgi:hypothetical protein
VKAFGPHYERWRELAARMFHVPPDEWAWTEVMAWNIMAVMAARKAGA